MHGYVHEVTRAEADFKTFVSRTEPRSSQAKSVR